MTAKRSLSGNVVRLRKRRSCPGQPALVQNADVLQFPDKLGLNPPTFDPANEVHADIWRAVWETSVMYKRAREAPKGHPLRAWYDREFERSFASARAINPNV